MEDQEPDFKFVPLTVTCRTVKRFFAYGKGFSSADRAWQYCAKREINRSSDGHVQSWMMLPSLFPLSECPCPENISCSDFGRKFCFCEFKRWIRYRGAVLSTGANALKGDELRSAILGFAGLRTTDLCGIEPDYEHMPKDEVRRQLIEAGIDPDELDQRTRDKLAEVKGRLDDLFDDGLTGYVGDESGIAGGDR